MSVLDNAPKYDPNAAADKPGNTGIRDVDGINVDYGPKFNGGGSTGGMFSGSGIKTWHVLLILAVLGGLAYWFFVKKKK